MNRQTLDKLRGLDFEFPESYDEVADLITASRQKEAENARIVAIEFLEDPKKNSNKIFRPDKKVNDIIQYFIVKVKLTTEFYTNSVVVEIDGKTISAYRKSDVFRQNEFIADVSIDFSNRLRVEENFELKARLIDAMGKVSYEKSKSVNVKRGGFVEKPMYERDLTVEDVRRIVNLLRANTYYKSVNTNTKKTQLIPIIKLPYLANGKIFHMNHESGKFNLEVVTNNSYENFTAQLNKIFDKYEINNLNRKCHFLSQIFIETQYFSQTIESDNNYTQNYDPLRGRGFIHLTLKDNYKRYTKYKNEIDKIAIDFEKNYSLISTNMEYAADASGWYWKFGSVKGNINPIAEIGTPEIVTPYINAASLKLLERKNAFILLTKIFKNEIV